MSRENDFWEEHPSLALLVMQFVVFGSVSLVNVVVLWRFGYG